MRLFEHGTENSSRVRAITRGEHRRNEPPDSRARRRADRSPARGADTGIPSRASGAMPFLAYRMLLRWDGLPYATTGRHLLNTTVPAVKTRSVMVTTAHSERVGISSSGRHSVWPGLGCTVPGGHSRHSAAPASG